MISLVPHHVPRMIGFSDGGRVDIDRFGRDAAMIGAAGTLSRIDSLARSALERGGEDEGPNRLVADVPKRLSGPSDSTVRSSSEDA